MSPKKRKKLKHPKKDGASMDDIVFENRNKAYGAYKLRKLYSSHLIIGYIIGVTALIFLHSLPAIIKRITAPDMAALEIMVNLNNDADTIAFLTNLQPPPPPPVKEEVETKVQPKPANVQPEVAKEEEILAADTTAMEDTPIDSVVTFSDSAGIVDSLVNLPDSIPHFPGGHGWMLKYIKDNLQYPWAELEAGIEGIVVIGFIVAKDGSIEDIEIKEGRSIFMNNEAERLVNNMPKWLPAKRKGKPIKMPVNISITFELPKQE